MIRCIVGLTFFFTLTLPNFHLIGVDSSQKLKNELIKEFNHLEYLFQVKYAPYEWKKTFANWDLSTQIARSKTKVLSSKNLDIREGRRIIKEFLDSTKDYHVSAHFYSTEAAFLPFQVRSAGGRYFIAWVSDTVKIPMTVQDEIITFNDRPIDDVVQELKSLGVLDKENLTEQAIATMLLTMRSGHFGHVIPKGKVNIKLKRAKTNQIVSFSIDWSYVPEKIPFGLFRSNVKLSDSMKVHTPFSSKSNQVTLSKRVLETPVYKTLKTIRKNARTIYGGQDPEIGSLGSKQSPFPVLGKTIWKASESHGFHAYMFKNSKNKVIGYIRIPTYCSDLTEEECTEMTEEFASVIRLFEKRCEALIVDQLHNPGGALLYAYALVSLLTPDLLILPSTKRTITQQDVDQSLTILEAIEEAEKEAVSKTTQKTSQEIEFIAGFPITKEFIKTYKEHLRFILEEWNAGRTLTHPTYEYGITQIMSHPWGCYTKPILVLVDEMDFSCADILPAILQDNGRATIFGVRTAGAGGSVETYQHPNLLGIEGYTITTSLIERLDRNPIENLGVAPDIVYNLTPEDLQNGYKGYLKTIDQVINGMLH